MGMKYKLLIHTIYVLFFTHHVRGSVDLRFKMPSNSAFKPSYNGFLDNLNWSQHILKITFIDGKQVYSSVFGNSHIMITRMQPFSFTRPS